MADSAAHTAASGQGNEVRWGRVGIAWCGGVLMCQRVQPVDTYDRVLEQMGCRVEFDAMNDCFWKVRAFCRVGEHGGLTRAMR
jgi:hypothetical protein